MKTKLFFTALLILGCLITTPVLVHAQFDKKSFYSDNPFNKDKHHNDDEDDEDENENEGCPKNHNVPLDGGVTILLGVGALYGFKKASNKRKVMK